jgi:hypothetical protein
MARGYRFLRSILIHDKISPLCLMAVIVLCISGISPAIADPPTGTFYYPPDNTPPGPPPNYNQVDTSYFRGQPPIPFPPPDSGGFYIWFDDTGAWSIANHIYSQGNSLEQFHGSVLALLDEPPTPGVNIFATNFELFGDTTSSYCYEQNDRWGWYQWSEHLYEIWWDVSTKEWRQGEGDPNDFMIIAITGCAIDFNIWSSGHSAPFDLNQVFLGESMIRLSDVPGFEDTYPGITDPYQSQAGNDPTGDPNITVFTPIEGIGASYNLDGSIPSGQTYPCGPVLGEDYGTRFAGNFVYEGNGIQFSSSCLTDPCAFNEPPVAVSPADTAMIVCELSEICLPGFSFSDPDGNLLSVEVIGGTLDGETVCLDPVEGVNTITLICTDDCGAADTAITEVTVTLNSPPVITCPADISIDCSTSPDPSITGYATAVDDNDPAPAVTYSDEQNGNIIARTWTATDFCGSASQCAQAITIEDTTPPTLDCPEGMTLQCPEELPPPDPASLEVSDDCDPTPIVTHMGDSSDGNFCPEVITRTYRATDASGNYAECTQIITIDDNIPPAITCPADISIDCNDPTDPSFTGIATATDNCQDGILMEFFDVQDDNIITRTWMADDHCGNSDQCVQIITITGTEPPVVSCPDDMTVTMCEIGDEVCIGGFFYEDPDGNLASVEVNVGTLEGNTLCFVPVEGENEIILTVTDECGLTATCTTIITAVVNSAPEITCVGDTTIIISDLEMICLPMPMNDPDDNIETVEVTGGEMVEGDLCFYPDWGINPITIVCTDSCGMSDVCEMDITVGCCDFTPGDASGDEEVDLLDATMLISLYRDGTPLPDTCDCRPENPIYPFYGAADVDGDCIIYTLADVTHIICYVRGLLEDVFYCPCCPPTGGWMFDHGGGTDPSNATTRYRNTPEGLRRIE